MACSRSSFTLASGTPKRRKRSSVLFCWVFGGRREAVCAVIVDFQEQVFEFFPWPFTLGFLRCLGLGGSFASCVALGALWLDGGSGSCGLSFFDSLSLARSTLRLGLIGIADPIGRGNPPPSVNWFMPAASRFSAFCRSDLDFDLTWQPTPVKDPQPIDPNSPTRPNHHTFPDGCPVPPRMGRRLETCPPGSCF